MVLHTLLAEEMILCREGRISPKLLGPIRRIGIDGPKWQLQHLRVIVRCEKERKVRDRSSTFDVDFSIRGQDFDASI